MPLSQDTLRFIREHRHDDVRSLALQARRYPSVDMPAAITQISGWQIANPASVAGFSAVAYLFGERLREELRVPVGVIDCSWGGTPPKQRHSIKRRL